MVGGRKRNMPTLHTRIQRVGSILTDTPGIFSFDAHGISPKQKEYAYTLYSLRKLGRAAVLANKDHIDRLAAKYDLDPRLMRAIIYMENAHGWYDAWYPWNKTFRPGNIDPDL